MMLYITHALFVYFGSTFILMNNLHVGTPMLRTHVMHKATQGYNIHRATYESNDSILLVIAYNWSLVWSEF